METIQWGGPTVSRPGGQEGWMQGGAKRRLNTPTLPPMQIQQFQGWLGATDALTNISWMRRFFFLFFLVSFSFFFFLPCSHRNAEIWMATLVTHSFFSLLLLFQRNADLENYWRVAAWTCRCVIRVWCRVQARTATISNHTTDTLLPHLSARH